MSPVFMCLVGMAVVVGAILKFRLHPFLALMLGALVVGVLAPGEASFAGVGKRLAGAFGTGCGKVGLVIAMAAFLFWSRWTTKDGLSSRTAILAVNP